MTTAAAQQRVLTQAFADVVNSPIGGRGLQLRDARRRYVMDEIDIEQFEAMVERILRNEPDVR